MPITTTSTTNLPQLDLSGLRLTYSQLQQICDRHPDIRLGWLINPQDRQVEIYRIDRDRETLTSPTSLSGENV